MPSRLLEGIATKWDADSLGTTFVGGIWFGQMPTERNPRWPYVVVVSLGDAPSIWTSTSQFNLQGVQISVFHKGGTDPITTLGGHMRTLHTAFDFAALTLTGGYVVEMRPTLDDIRPDPDAKDVFIGDMNFTCLRRKAVNYSP